MLLLAGLAGLLLCYTGYRASQLSMTHDEASTYLNYMDVDVLSCFSDERCWGTANNHLLNTWLIQKSTRILGISDFVIRLPNLLGHLIYLISTIFLMQLLTKHRWLLLAGFALLNFNPYLLEFFSLARGYGLNVSFSMAALFFLVRFVYTEKYLDYFGCFAMLWFAILSNFIGLPSFLACWVASLAILLLRYYNKQLDFKQLLLLQTAPGSIAFLLFLLLKRPLAFLSKNGEFIYGTDSLFETFRLLIVDSLQGAGYLDPSTPEVFLAIFYVFLFTSAIFGSWHFFSRARNPLHSAFLVILLTFAALIIALVGAHVFAGARYFEHRKSLIFIPLSALLITLGIILFQEYRGRWGTVVALLLLATSGYHLLRTANFTHCREWSYDRYTRDIALYLDEVSESDQKLKVGTNWVFHPALHYYIETRKLNIEIPKYQKELTPDFQNAYYYLMHYDREKFTGSYKTVLVHDYRSLVKRVE